MTDSAPKATCQHGQTNNVSAGKTVVATEWHNRLHDYSLIRVRYLEDIARIKAERSLYMGFGVRGRQLEALMFLDTVLTLSGRKNMALSVVVDFSGKTRIWKAKIWRSFAELKAAGVIEEVAGRVKKLPTMGISVKGYSILSTFDDKRAEIVAGLRANPSKRWFKSVRIAA